MNGFYRRYKNSVFSYIEDIRTILDKRLLPPEVINFILRNIDLDENASVYGVKVNHMLRDNVMLSLSMEGKFFRVFFDGYAEYFGNNKNTKIKFDYNIDSKNTILVRDLSKFDSDRIICVIPDPIAYVIDENENVYFNGKIFNKSDILGGK